MPFSHLLYEVKDRVAYITLNRPEKRNALHPQLVEEIKHALAEAQHNKAVKLIVVKANGPAFSAGADLEHLQRMRHFSHQQHIQESQALCELYEQIYFHDKVVIAWVQGHAIAGGCGLAAVCDFCYSVPEAKFGFTEVKIGFIPAIVSVFVTRKIGEGRARALLLSGELISARQAADIGLINEVFPANEFMQRAEERLENILYGASAFSLTQTKNLLHQIQDIPVSDALKMAIAANAEARNHPDCHRGIDAFLNKQSIRW
ncbi:methylglutaconyl-CoA hydratase [Thermoflavifilum aggregans]|uniref:Methylglutaconyl-CoA hydratase n=1 Tax=Thermoflavifilum aggregans TaxID=454188 RepID=A0A2M9CWF8_9BACT|nr:enoyl-CoA hydratase/isomerase family protein [Thermoflavifilum aggregans]PJJ76215.1 methylglutaconyl-CoA hydratase [Thermoflavifilum aggregans]